MNRYSTTGDVAGGLRVEGTRRISYGAGTMHNHDVTDELAARSDDLRSLLRQAVRHTARALLDTVPPAERNAAESQFLRDCAREEGRRDLSDVTLARLLVIQGRADSVSHALSEELRAIEARMAASVSCATEASDAEDESNYPLNMAQKLAERERTPTRWAQVVELARRQLNATRRLIDAASVRAFGKIA